MLIEIKNSNLNGTINLPASKSIAARLIFLSTFYEKNLSILGNGLSEDIKTYFQAIKIIKPFTTLKLLNNNRFLIYLPPMIDKKLFNKDQIFIFNCNDSAFCLRSISMISSFFSAKKYITGSNQLLKRPQSIVLKTLKQSNISCKKIGFNGYKSGFLIKGIIKPGFYNLNTKITTQHISGLLLTLPFLEKDSIIQIKGNFNYPYIIMTVDILKRLNCKIELKVINKNLAQFYIYGNNKPDFSKFNYDSGKIQIEVESDWSAASFFIVAASIKGPIRFLNLDINSVQADKKILDIIKIVGAKIKIIENKEDYIEGEISKSSFDILEIEKANLNPFEYNIDDCPDLFPIISVLAAFCDGVSKIYGIKRLKYKESDRIRAIYQNFKKIGIETKIEKNCFLIYGSSKNIYCKNNNFNTEDIFNEKSKIFLSSFNDHRIFMSLVILASFFNKNIVIEDYDSYKKSYANFLDDFKRLGGRYEFIR